MVRTREPKAASKNRSGLLSGLMQLMLILLVLPGTGFAASVVLEWDPSTDADLAGYKAYYQANSPAVPFAGTGAAEGSAPIDVGNVITTTISGLDPNNSYFFTVTAYNSAGLESVYSNVIEIKESAPPTVSISSPSPSASLSGIVSVGAAAADNVGVSKVQFFVNGVLSAETAASPHAFSWDTSALTPGAYTLSAKAFDAAGNEADADSVAVTVAGDTTAPTVTLAAGNAAASGTVVVSASATDNVLVTRLEIYLDGALVLTSNQNSVSYNWKTAAESNGSHVLSAKAYDAGGNEGRSTEATVTVFNDTIAPAVSINPVETPSTETAQAISGLVSDNHEVATVTVQVGSGPATAALFSAGKWSFPLTGLTVGGNPITVRATDNSGNSSSATTSIVVGEPAVSTPEPITPEPITPEPITPEPITPEPTTPEPITPVPTTPVPTTPVPTTPVPTTPVPTTPVPTTPVPTTPVPTTPVPTTPVPTTPVVTTPVVTTPVVTTPVVTTPVVTTPAPLTLYDVQLALRIASGRSKPTSAQVAELDVAPYVGGKSHPNGKVDTGDVVVLLSKLVGKLL